MCTPSLRCTALQSRHMNTPYVTDAQDGLRAGQSKQTLFSIFDLSFLKTLFFSTVST